MRGIKEFMDQGALLGHLWMEGYFEVGDPLIASGGPKSGKERTLAEVLDVRY